MLYEVQAQEIPVVVMFSGNIINIWANFDHLSCSFLRVERNVHAMTSVLSIACTDIVQWPFVVMFLHNYGQFSFIDGAKLKIYVL